MEIAPGVDSTRWPELQLDDPTGADWIEAAEILRGRIQERFMDPTDHLIAAEQAKAPTERRFGFAVLALDCMLVETLGAFIDGLTDTRNVSGPVFCKFLRERRQFAPEFQPAGLAERFYSDFRCGILHQAEVGGLSKVWSVGPLLQVLGNAIIVNRNEFHSRLKAEFASYLGQIADAKNASIRTNFRTKMNFISRS